MKKLIFIIALGVMTCFSSCMSKEEQQLRAQELVKERIAKVDLTQPDHYPLFAGCDELEQAQKCFYDNMQQVLKERLKKHSFNLEGLQKDSILLKIVVTKNGEVLYEQAANVNDMIGAQLDSLFDKSLTPLCNVSPALKHGVPVETSYIIPVILQPVIN